MKFDKLTIKSQEAVGEAQSQASSRGHSIIEPAHLLRALLAQPEGSTIPVLQKLGVPIEPLQRAMEQHLGRIPKVTGGAQPQISQTLGEVLDAAFAEAAGGVLKCVDDGRRHLWLPSASDWYASPRRQNVPIGCVRRS